MSVRDRIDIKPERDTFQSDSVVTSSVEKCAKEN